MTELKNRLRFLGVESNQPTVMVVEDLLNLAEYLYEKLEETERQRFQTELNRILKPTN